jgi:hypothetical protein
VPSNRSTTFVELSKFFLLDPCKVTFCDSSIAQGMFVDKCCALTDSKLRLAHRARFVWLINDYSPKWNQSSSRKEWRKLETASRQLFRSAQWICAKKRSCLEVAGESDHAANMRGREGSQPFPTRFLFGNISYILFHSWGCGQTRWFSLQ